MRKWLYWETRFISARDDMRAFLKANNIKYELSGGNSFYHFEIFCNKEEEKLINNWLNTNKDFI